jgi:diadenosine tetraphosphate (Ap4A) HIT family hydrolase
MEHLWTPWRLAYVGAGTEPAACVFCDALHNDEASPLILYRGTTAFVILNLFPYNNAHLMVVPNRHVATLADATAGELQELMALARTAEIAITEVYAPHGMNLGARRSALERRHQLHDRHRPDARAARGTAGHGRQIASGLREDSRKVRSLKSEVRKLKAESCKLRAES